MYKKILGLLLAIILTACTEKKGNLDLSGVQFNSQFINSALFFEIQRDNSETQFVEFVTKDKTEKLRTLISQIDLEPAKKIILQKSFDIKSLFATQKVPYFGQITKNTQCVQSVEIKNQLIENEKELSLFLNLTATETLVYGSCLSDQEVYKSQLLYLYCKTNKTLYEIKYFYPIQQNYKNQIAHCN